MKSLEIVLTPNVIKRAVYAADPDFVSALALVRTIFSDSHVLNDWLWNTAALLLRPDALAGGSASAILPLLRLRGLVPVVAMPVFVRAEQAVGLWRYQFNVATPERRVLLRQIMGMGPSLYVLFHDRSLRRSAPATVHLTHLKGTAVVGRRRAGHIRTVAGPSIANVLSYVHVSDDPADVLREMAVLFDPSTRLSLVVKSHEAVDRTSEVVRLIRTLENLGPREALRRDPGDPSLEGRDATIVQQWSSIIAKALTLRSFVSGESYEGRHAFVPDDSWLSLPLDSHLR